ncbi:MAG: gamma-glutamyl-gamma-aminobutyrate hydrolase family protein [Chloroflexi bacterium]|nr:gamma-glutamyl-gamma-aminobutyrate hydrolase family protein [Chloroflexota bacterium]
MPRPLIGITTHRRNSDGGSQDVFGLMAADVEAIRRAGGLPVLVPLGLAEDELRDLHDRIDGLLLSGGGDVEPSEYGLDRIDDLREVDADRDRVELTLARWAVDAEKPLLGICRGAQTFNVALGGTLYRDIAIEHPGHTKHDFYPGYPRNRLSHAIRIAEETRLARTLGTPIVQVNSLHHQAARDVAPSLTPAAHAPDGVIEALELPGHRFALGVQWHPEWLTEMPEMRRLFEAFVRAAR